MRLLPVLLTLKVHHNCRKLTTYSAIAKPGETLDFKVVVVHPFKDKDDLNLIYDNARQQ